MTILDSNLIAIQKSVSQINSTKKAAKEYSTQQATEKFSGRYDYQ